MAGQEIRVWDLPVRLFHWSLVLCLLGSWWSAENREMEIHYYFGMVIFGLLVFRLLWGVVGSSTARFASFVVSPTVMLDFVRRKNALPSRQGHNPVGGYSVIAMLVALATQITTGLFATDLDGLESGPLSYLISFEASRIVAELHKIAFNVLLALIILHIISIFFYLAIQKRNLIWPMLTGRAKGADASWQDTTSVSHKWLVISIVAAAGTVWLIFDLSGI